METAGTQDTLDWVMGAKIECEQPNEYLYKFDGNFIFKDG